MIDLFLKGQVIFMDEIEQRKQLQSLAAEADVHQRRAQEMQNQMQALQMADVEVEKTTEALNNLKENKTTMFSLGAGMFVKGEMKDISKLLVNVGSNTLIEMDAENALKFLGERKDEIDKGREELLKGMQALSNRLRAIDVEARSIIGKQEH